MALLAVNNFQLNVNPMTEITNLVRINRAYTTLANIVDQNSQLNRSAVERLGKVA